MINEALEIFGVYFMFLVVYPLVFVGFAFLYPLWSLPGLAMAFVLNRYFKPALPIWIALWLMPGTVTCGAAMIAPLPVTAVGLFDPKGCGSPSSLCVCALLNLGLVYGVRAAYPRVKRLFASEP